ncbi:MAG: alpha/beta hydrolase [Acidimicrobiia bacterium]
MKDIAVSADGNPVHFEVDGDGAPALVFVHGWSCDRTYWSRQTGYFAGRYQVVAMDLAGHGESGANRQEWTMPAFGEDVVAVVEKLKLGRLVLIGHSMGGDVIVEAALRLADRVAGLVWVDTYATLGQSTTREEIEEFVDPFRRDFVTATQDLIRDMFPAGADAELVEWITTDAAAAPPEVAIDAIEHTFNNDRAIPARLKQLTAPVVAINSDYVPTDIESLARHGVRSVLMPGVGHFLMMEDPDTFNHHLDETIRGFV